MTAAEHAVGRLVPVMCTGAGGGAPGLTPKDYYVLSRVDGRTPARVLAQVVGMRSEELVVVLSRLRDAGLIQIPGFEKAMQPVAPPAAKADPPVGAAPTSSPRRGEPQRRAPDEKVVDLRSTNWPTRFEAFRKQVVVDEKVEGGMTEEQQLLVLYYHHHLRLVSYYDLFGVRPDASRDEIRKSYFRLSKAFHPDRWFRKPIGSHAERLHEIFKWLTRAYTVLGNERKRRGYDVLLKRGYVGEWQLEDPPSPPSSVAPQPAAPGAGSVGEEGARTGGATGSVLRMKARRAEAAGEWAEAADLYQRAVHLAPTTALRIRLIECMLKGHSPPAEMDRELRAAREADGENLDLLLLEAEIARRLGDARRAEACYAQVLVTEPTHPVARMGLERLRKP